MDNDVIIPEDVTKDFTNLINSFVDDSFNEYKIQVNELHASFIKIFDKMDFRTNYYFWAIDISSTITQIIYSYCWLVSWARFYRQNSSLAERTPTTMFQTSFYADYCTILVNSLKDKSAIMIYSCFEIVNPHEQILPYSKIMTYLNCKNQNDFVKMIDLCFGKAHFQAIKKFRDKKVHRLQPRIEIFDQQTRHFYWFEMSEQEVEERCKSTRDTFEQMCRTKREDLRKDHDEAYIKDMEEIDEQFINIQVDELGPRLTLGKYIERK